MPTSVSGNIFFTITSENATASNFKLYHHVALNSLYFTAKNDAPNYFWSAGNRIGMSMFNLFAAVAGFVW